MLPQHLALFFGNTTGNLASLLLVKQCSKPKAFDNRLPLAEEAAKQSAVGNDAAILQRCSEPDTSSIHTCQQLLEVNKLLSAKHWAMNSRG